jgi:lipopolysaccharide biosynthesis glycosyltransferase
MGNSGVNGSGGLGPIVLACDEAYAMPLATALRSMVEANRSSTGLNLSVLASDFSAHTKQTVLESLPQGSAALSWISVDILPFSELSTRPHISCMTYARLLLPSVLPETVSKVLYIDPDVLVLDDLAQLWDIDLGECVVGAVADIFSEANAKRLGLIGSGTYQPGDDAEGVGRSTYFNAGVLLIDLSRWRKERISEQAFAYLLQHPETELSDQDALNIACAKRWKRLDSRWNFQTHVTTRLSELDPDSRPRIVHFVTSSKPWIPSVRSRNAAFYDGFRDRTRFARTSVEKLRDSFVRSWSGVRNVSRRSVVRRLVERYWRACGARLNAAIDLTTGNR